MHFIGQICAGRQVSVWGIGYLGYTFILHLQSKGFCPLVYDFNEERLGPFRQGKYPAREQREAWSTKREIPTIDLERIRIAGDVAEMFDNNVHIISFPGKSESENSNLLISLSDHFLKNKEKIKDSLVLFQAAETPGDIQRYFISPLAEQGATCSCATAFRTDWSLEELSFANRRQVIAGHDQKALARAQQFLELIDIDHLSLTSIKEAEIYENARKSLEYTVCAFINQLSMAYSDSDVRMMVKNLLNEINIREIKPSVGPVSYKAAIATNQLMEGSRHPGRLHIVRDAELDSLSTILSYAEIISRRCSVGVTILGLSEKGDQKDIRLSPALILAERLIAEGLSVGLHDPYFQAEEVSRLVKGAKFININEESTYGDCLVLMTDHRVYKCFTQEDLNKLLSSTRLIIDNVGLWKHFSFPQDTFYHIPGDGKLTELER